MHTLIMFKIKLNKASIGSAFGCMGTRDFSSLLSVRICNRSKQHKSSPRMKVMHSLLSPSLPVTDFKDHEDADLANRLSVLKLFSTALLKATAIDLFLCERSGERQDPAIQL